MIRDICVKLFFRSIAPRPSRSPAEKSRSYRLPKTTANPAPNGRPLSQSRWTELSEPLLNGSDGSRLRRFQHSRSRENARCRPPAPRCYPGKTTKAFPGCFPARETTAVWCSCERSTPPYSSSVINLAGFVFSFASVVFGSGKS